jgi:hypothetical protein
MIGQKTKVNILIPLDLSVRAQPERIPNCNRL